MQLHYSRSRWGRTSVSNGSRAGGLDLDAIAARLKVLECGNPECGAPDCDAHRLSLAVIEECRALRAALEPIIADYYDYIENGGPHARELVKNARRVLMGAPERDL